MICCLILAQWRVLNVSNRGSQKSLPRNESESRWYAVGGDLRNSLETLQRGSNIVLFPDVDTVGPGLSQQIRLAQRQHALLETPQPRAARAPRQ